MPRTARLPVAALAFVTLSLSSLDSFAGPLQKAGIDTRLVGDCVAPRNLLCAIHEGEAAALAI